MYENETFAEALSGAGYLLTKNSASCLYWKGLDTKYLYLNDQFVTGMLRGKCGLSITHNSDFHAWSKSGHQGYNKSDLILHYYKDKASMQDERITPEKMREIHTYFIT